MEHNAEDQQRTDSGEEVHECDFLTRVTQLPLVRSVMDTTLDVYQKAKEKNGLVRFTLNNAEKTASFAAERAKPMVAKFEVPIGFVDVLACKTLDKLEQTVPIIKKSPEEIVNESKKMYDDAIVKPTLAQYNNVKDYGLGKVNAIKDYGVQKATTLANTKYGQIVTGKVDELLVRADGMVDNYLPCQFEEGQEADMKMDDTSNTIEKAALLSRKLRQRMYCHGLIQLKAARKKTDEILANLYVTIEMIQNIKSNLSDKNKALKEHFVKLWEEMDKTNYEASDKTLEQKLFYVAKQLTTQLHSTYQKMASTLRLFPAQFQPSISNVQNYIGDLYGQFIKAKSWDEVSSVVLSQAQEAIKRLQTGLSHLYDSALQSKALSWMADTKAKPVVSNGNVTPCAEDGKTGDSSLPNEEKKEAESAQNQSKSSECNSSNDSHEHSDENYQQKNCTANEGMEFEQRSDDFELETRTIAFYPCVNQNRENEPSSSDEECMELYIRPSWTITDYNPS